MRFYALDDALQFIVFHLCDGNGLFFELLCNPQYAFYLTDFLSLLDFETLVIFLVKILARIYKCACKIIRPYYSFIRPFIERVLKYTHKYNMIRGPRKILSLLKAESTLVLKLMASAFDDR